MSRILVALVVIGVLLHARSASAQTDAKAAAQQKMAQGAQLLEQGQPAEALALFKEAYQQVQNPRYQYNIGVACQALGRDAEALQAFEAFVANAQGVRQEYLDDAQKQMELLRGRVATVKITSPEAGATVLVDGRDTGRTPLAQALTLDAGEHRFMVRKLSFEPFEKVVTLRRGDRLELAAALRPVVQTVAPPVAVVAPLPSEPPPENPPIYKRWWLWSAVGAAVVTGVVVALVINKGSEGPQCPANIPCLTP
jgi:tetratricopeptide (TPR) repeat protein